MYNCIRFKNDNSLCWKGLHFIKNSWKRRASSFFSDLESINRKSSQSPSAGFIHLLFRRTYSWGHWSPSFVIFSCFSSPTFLSLFPFLSVSTNQSKSQIKTPKQSTKIYQDEFSFFFCGLLEWLRDSFFI